MPTVLHELLVAQHLKAHSSFLAAYDRYAARLDPPIPAGHGPGKAQYYEWLSGQKMKGLPLDAHCRVLAAMFPSYTVEALFEPAGPALRSRRPMAAKTDLEKFLGHEMVTEGTTLVYPTFTLAPDSTRALATAGVPRQHIYTKQGSVFATEHRIDVPVALAENDVRGLLYVLTLLQRDTDIATRIETDLDVVAHCDRPFISFGLSSNDCTHMYFESAAHPMFTIHDSLDGGNYLEHLELADGHAYRSDDRRNIGIVARVKPNPSQHPGRFWIFCAGLGPRGTTGASWYLAKHWRILHEQAGEHDFVAVCSVRSYSDETAELVHLMVDSERL
ncbi:hypothetical protein [Nocardia sp. NPDC050435]|uniref:hypothetical protein n=1 Tax=Nocardia sp. NPDC050435 TaxID=3155040 RepID=UPI0033EF19AD